MVHIPWLQIRDFEFQIPQVQSQIYFSQYVFPVEDLRGIHMY